MNNMGTLFVDIVIVLAAVAIVAAIGISAWSVVVSLRKNKPLKRENGVPIRNIRLCTAALVAAVVVPTLLIASMTDMCIITSLVMLAVASVAVIVSRIRTLSRVRRRA